MFVYATLAFTALVAPGVHLLGYKRCILIGAAGRVLTRLVLLYGTTLPAMVLMQVRQGETCLQAYRHRLKQCGGAPGRSDGVCGSSTHTSTLPFNSQPLQVTFGLAMASDVVVAAYLYSLVPADEFLPLTALVAASGLLGYVLAAELSQAMLWGGCSLPSLFYVSAATVGTSAVLSLWLRFTDSASAVRAAALAAKLAAAVFRAELLATPS